MIQRMWRKYYKKKMNKEMKKSFQVEDAFQKIRSQTGNTDVQDIVHKFLTKEQTYAQLLSASARTRSAGAPEQGQRGEGRGAAHR